MNTPVQTTQNFGLIATAATTLSTLRLRSMSWMDSTVGQNPREGSGFTAGLPSSPPASLLGPCTTLVTRKCAAIR